MNADTPLGEFVTDGTELPNAYSISAAADGNIYVGCSDYITTGEVCVFSKEGRLLHRFDSGGFNPIAAEKALFQDFEDDLFYDVISGCPQMDSVIRVIAYKTIIGILHG